MTGGTPVTQETTICAMVKRIRHLANQSSVFAFQVHNCLCAVPKWWLDQQLWDALGWIMSMWMYVVWSFIPNGEMSSSHHPFPLHASSPIRVTIQLFPKTRIHHSKRGMEKIHGLNSEGRSAAARHLGVLGKTATRQIRGQRNPAGNPHVIKKMWWILKQNNGLDLWWLEFERSSFQTE